MLQYSRDAVLHQPHGIRWGRRAANFNPTQAFPCKHSHRKCHPRYQPANLRPGCSSQPRAVRCLSFAMWCHVKQTACWACMHLRVNLNVWCRWNSIHADMVTCSLVVVLERRTLVHDLKTLELLRTLETPSNPKVPAKDACVGADACRAGIMSLCISQPQYACLLQHQPCYAACLACKWDMGGTTQIFTQTAYQCRIGPSMKHAQHRPASSSLTAVHMLLRISATSHSMLFLNLNPGRPAAFHFCSAQLTCIGC